jgi:phage anti-repressor protein
MTHTTFSIELAQSLFDSEEQYPVDFNVAWKWLGYSRKDSCLRMLLNNFLENEDFTVSFEPPQDCGLGSFEYVQPQPTINYKLTNDCLKMLGMLAKTEKGKLVRQYFLQCEKTLKATAKLLGVTGNGEVIDNELIANMQTKIEQLESINYELKIFIDKQLDEKKNAVIADYACFTDDLHGNPLVFLKAMKDERDEAILKAENVEFSIDRKYREKWEEWKKNYINLLPPGSDKMDFVKQKVLSANYSNLKRELLEILE